MFNVYKDVLSFLDEYFYIIDTKTFEIIYISDKLKGLIKNYDKSAPCYKSIAGADKPCMYCPYAFLSKNNREFFIERKHELLQENTEFHYVLSSDSKSSYMTVFLSAKKAYDKKLDLIKNDMYKTIFEIMKIISLNARPEDKIPWCLNDIAVFFNADGCGYYQIKDNDHYISTGFVGKPLPLERKDIKIEWNRYFDDEKYLTVQKFLPGSKSAGLVKENNIKELVVYGVRRNNVCIGFLYLLNPKKNEGFEVLLSSAAPFIESELEEEEMTEQLSFLANTDLLTGTKNRTMYEKDTEEIQKKKVSIGIIFIDINGLKQANDEFGHEYGDDLIKNVSKLLLSVFEDNVYRIGGDEFVVLLPDIKNKVFDDKITALSSAITADTPVAVGYKWFNSSSGIKNKIKAVDELMYKAKEEYYKTHERRR